MSPTHEAHTRPYNYKLYAQTSLELNAKAGALSIEADAKSVEAGFPFKYHAFFALSRQLARLRFDEFLGDQSRVGCR